MTTNLFEVAVQFFQGYPETLTFVVDLLRRDHFLDNVVKEISLTASESQPSTVLNDVASISDNKCTSVYPRNVVAVHA